MDLYSSLFGIARVCIDTTANKDRFGMTDRSRRESLLLGAIAGAIIAIVIVVPIIALSL